MKSKDPSLWNMKSPIKIIVKKKKTEGNPLNYLYCSDKKKQQEYKSIKSMTFE
jgi:hypothetical protein